jgi:hypothetical protein
MALPSSPTSQSPQPLFTVHDLTYLQIYEILNANRHFVSQFRSTLAAILYLIPTAPQRREQLRTTADRRPCTFVLQCGRTLIFSRTEELFGMVLDASLCLPVDFVAIRWCPNRSCLAYRMHVRLHNTFAWEAHPLQVPNGCPPGPASPTQVPWSHNRHKN